MSSPAVIETLAWMRKAGFMPVPLRKASKASLSEKYVDLSYQPPDDDYWKERDIGIGIVTGPKHKGPVDIDLDCPEAVFFAARFLPKTQAVFGRASKRASHYLYRVDVKELPKRALVDPITKSTIIEIRADGGHQTVMPGSVHEDTGELVEWTTAAPEVATVEAQDLEFAAKKVAIAVLVARHLWADGQRNEVVKHLTGTLFYMGWKLEEVRDLTRAVMDACEDSDTTRLKTVTATYKKGDSGGKITGANTLRGFCDPKVVDRIVEWAGDDQSAFLQDYNERFAVVTVKGKFRIAETVPLEQGGAPVLFAKEDFLNFMSTDTATLTDEKGKAVKVAKAKLWLGHPRRRTYRAMDFVPGVEDTSPVLNLWTGWVVNAKDMREGSCRAWLDLLYYVICGSDDKLYHWMLNWFANILREPRNKPLTAPVIVGTQGAGKSLLLYYFGKVLGPTYTVVTNEEHIFGRFNRHLATCLLLHSEEALFGGDRKHKGIIKSLISDEYRMFEPKGVDAEQVRNYLRLVLTSNEIWAAPAEANDRRYTVIDMNYRKAPDDMIQEVLGELDNGGPSALFKYLTEDFKYDPSIARINLKNDAIRDLKIINFDPVASWWYETLRTATILPDYLAWATKPSGEEWPTVVASGALYLSMVLQARTRNKQPPDVTYFALEMNKMVGQKLLRKQQYYSNPMADDAPREVKLLAAKQYSITNMPSLEVCRKAFELYMGQKLQWPEEAEEREKPVNLRF